MPFLEERISIGIRRGTRGGPTGARIMIYDASGKLSVQTFLREDAVHTYRFDFGKTLQDAEGVRDFFYVIMFGEGGPYTGFRARDWNDFRLTQSNSRLVATTGGLQICRVYTVGAFEHLRPIRKIEPGSATIFNAGSPVGGAVIDNNTGIVTSGGDDAYTVEANFDIPVTFAEDDALANVGLDGNFEVVIQELGQIELVEVISP